jgi:UDP-N-acetylmuramoyl-L-alanyl-D-glutamate--2,6-diaminopimelate ligase
MRSKLLTELVSGINTLGGEIQARLNISEVVSDSRKIRPGALFVAVRGFKSDGHRFLEKAAAAGAVAAVVEQVNPNLSIPQIQVPNARLALACLTYNFYLPEIAAVEVTGITGTNGKTTTSYLVRAIIEASGTVCGLIGTIAHYFGTERIDAQNTTPEATDICAMISVMAQEGQKACVMEVSSHALSLHRVAGLKYRAAVFTNLSRDHMDFYKDEDDYFLAKAQLFNQLLPDGKAVINIDDAYGRRLLQQISNETITFGFSEKAAVRALEWKLDLPHMQVKLQTPEGSLNIKSSLISEFNVQNIMASVATGLALGISTDFIKKGIENVTQVSGRLETYELTPGVLGVIDYAHTPDALQKALQALRPLTAKNLIVLFGCGGDRDRGKRPQMGKIAEELGDRVIVTTDNPRAEDARRIMDDIVAGMSRAEKRSEIVDRREAIQAAVKMARPGDVILVAGKGHESYQEINGVKYDFNEAAILLEAAKNA